MTETITPAHLMAPGLLSEEWTRQEGDPPRWYRRQGRDVWCMAYERPNLRLLRLRQDLPQTARKIEWDVMADEECEEDALQSWMTRWRSPSDFGPAIGRATTTRV